jgi:hypothetical protein
MQLPLNLAGSYGEPRPNHFHAGIDIKTNGVEGEPVYSIYDGYISRIKVSSVGYGKAVYITHTNGYTSVYAHLSKFSEAVENYVHQQHYAQKKSEFDLYPNTSRFTLKQNDLIGYSGNTGGSSAPHLHFEIRDTKTEHALNPLDFYPNAFYSDTIPPQLNKVKVYPFDNSFYAYTAGITAPLIKRDNHYTTLQPIKFSDFPDFCFSLEGFDKHDTSASRNGIDKMEVYNQQKLVFSYHMNRIDFEKTRMCNAFVDYHEMKQDSGYYYNLYRFKNNTYPIYNSSNNGFFKINPKDTVSLEIYCYDYNENKTEIRLEVIRNDSASLTDSAYAFPADSYVYRDIAADKKDSLEIGNFKITFKPKSFYDDIALTLQQSDYTNTVISPVFDVYHMNDYIPLQYAARITMKSSNIPEPEKIVLMHRSLSGKENALRTAYSNALFTAETKELGQFYIQYDTIIPEITLLTTEKKISVKINDNLSGINTYNGYIDGKWVNFYYDAKLDLLEYNYDAYCSKGEHTLTIVVTDNKGNKNSLSQKFIY